MLNHVVLIGRLAGDPELRYTPSGHAVANFTLAVEQRVKNEDGSRPCDFIDCVAWRGAAEFLSNYTSKGRMLAVAGRLQVRKWTAQDGSHRKAVEVVAEEVKALDRKREETEQ